MKGDALNMITAPAKSFPAGSGDCSGNPTCQCDRPTGPMLPPAPPEREEIACCGPAFLPESGPDARPGYVIEPFVESFIDGPAGKTPMVRTRLGWRDRLGTIRARTGFSRDDYKIAPGLYGIGTQGPESPVLVSANYKLSFDALRSALGGESVWLLVLDTRGVNVWCAAGKGSFGTAEVIRRVREARLEQVVTHRRLILPQFSATGVSAREVKRACGFRVIWGPVRAADIPKFLANGMTADTAMRRVTFTFRERVVLIPVEITLIGKAALWSLLGLMLISGIGPTIFSVRDVWHRGIIAVGAALAGVIGGAVLTPALLPWLPGRAFAVKGALIGTAVALMTGIFVWD